MQCMLMVINNLKIKEISVAHSLSPKPVNSYRYRIFDKVHVKGDVELTKLAIKHGVLDSEAVA